MAASDAGRIDRWPDGTVDRICVESLLPPEWLARHGGAAVGSTVPLPLDLNEMGLPEGMTARVVANEPCPPIEPGPGRVVLTTVNHLNPRVVELTLAAPDGTRETVRPTAFHKFYSETRGRWLSAEDLQPDERLRGLTGPLQVVSQRPVPGVHRVYNMTVEGEHVYHVSTLGVLAHNMDCAQPQAPKTAAARQTAGLGAPKVASNDILATSNRLQNKHDAWRRYDGDLSLSQWSKKYDQLQINAARGRWREQISRRLGLGEPGGRIWTPVGDRIPDAVDGVILREIKDGYVTFSPFIRKQIGKDFYLQRRGYLPEWHFYGGAPSQRVLDQLQTFGIPYTIH